MRGLLLVFLIISFAAVPVFSQVNEFGLSPVSLNTYPRSDTGTVVIDINIKIVDHVDGFIVPVLVSGTSNPILGTALTGGLADLNPPGFNSPGLVSGFSDRIVNPYPTAPGDPMLFVALDVGPVDTTSPSSKEWLVLEDLLESEQYCPYNEIDVILSHKTSFESLLINYQKYKTKARFYFHVSIPH